MLVVASQSKLLFVESSLVFIFLQILMITTVFLSVVWVSDIESLL